MSNSRKASRRKSPLSQRSRAPRMTMKKLAKIVADNQREMSSEIGKLNRNINKIALEMKLDPEQEEEKESVQVKLGDKMITLSHSKKSDPLSISLKIGSYKELVLERVDGKFVIKGSEEDSVDESNGDDLEESSGESEDESDSGSDMSDSDSEASDSEASESDSSGDDSDMSGEDSSDSSPKSEEKPTEESAPTGIAGEIASVFGSSSSEESKDKQSSSDDSSNSEDKPESSSGI